MSNKSYGSFDFVVIHTNKKCANKSCSLIQILIKKFFNQIVPVKQDFYSLGIEVLSTKIDVWIDSVF